MYLDACYLVRLYVEDDGWETVRRRAASDRIACAVHGRAETVSAFHRKWREGALGAAGFRAILDQFDHDCRRGGVMWLPLSPAVLQRATRAYADAPRSIVLRAADALHLACAAENHFREVYTNDGHMLAAAAHFRIEGVVLR